VCGLGWEWHDLSHELAVEILSGGNATRIDFFDPSVLIDGSPIDKLIFVGSAVGTRGASIAGRTATTALGRSIQSLERQLASGEGPWRLIASHAEPATSVVYRGGTSIEQHFVQPETGEHLFRHIIVRGEEIIRQTVWNFKQNLPNEMNNIDRG
jgi:hypothetical protein